MVTLLASCGVSSNQHTLQVPPGGAREGCRINAQINTAKGLKRKIALIIKSNVILIDAGKHDRSLRLALHAFPPQTGVWCMEHYPGASSN